MALNVIVTIGIDVQTQKWLSGLTAGIGSKIDLILANLEKIMATLQEVLDDVTAESTAIDSVAALIQGLRDQINSAGLSPADQAKVDAIFTAAESNKAKIAAALAANVPPAA
jgi:uncharacterized protein YoxC